VLTGDFKDFVQCLAGRDVRFLIVGGYAVAFHGYPRYTKDLDIWIRSDTDNAERILLALADFGFGSLAIVESDFLNAEQVIQLGQPPNRIDMLTQLKGVDFDECYDQRVVETIDGTEVPFIDLPHLVANKRATGRAQDLADAENLDISEPSTE
jgi:hypothetical protein